MDLALAIENIIPNAEYFGSTNENTEAQFDALDWQDSRKKPDFKAIQASWDSMPAIEESAASKTTVLEKLGITAEEAQLLLG